ncbi:hypothetical protein [Streptomyces sp. SM1]|uniref:hypothetical protein n=1 Tax=Streptomyces sp. SM1 TaxID=402229 RepID=UPI0011B07226|nr:hypothetical protein [Streptomyces sp. SM1]
MDAAAPTDLTGRAPLRKTALEPITDLGLRPPRWRAVAAAAELSPAFVIQYFRRKQGLRAAVDQDVPGPDRRRAE